MKLSDLIIRDGISVDAEMTGPGSSDQGPHYSWEVTLRRGGEEYQLPDPLDSSDEPTALNVMALLLMGSSTATWAKNYEDWASGWSSDPAEWMSEEVYRRWLVIADGLERFLGWAWEEYVEAEKDD